MSRKNKDNKRGLFIFNQKLQHNDKEAAADGKVGIHLISDSNSGILIK